MEILKPNLEALIFASPSPVSLEDMRAAMQELLQTDVKNEELVAAIGKIQEQYKNDLYVFDLVEIAGGYQFMTKGAYHNTVAIHLKLTTKKRLSQPAMETLAIVAYKQPVSKSELEEIRGVNCDYALQKLLEKELVMIAGRSNGPGRPLLYSTTEKFMDYLGLKSLQDLPKPKDFKEVENSIGEMERG